MSYQPNSFSAWLVSYPAG